MRSILKSNLSSIPTIFGFSPEMALISEYFLDLVRVSFHLCISAQPCLETGKRGVSFHENSLINLIFEISWDGELTERNSFRMAAKSIIRRANRGEQLSPLG